MPERKRKLSELFPPPPTVRTTPLNKAKYPEERKVSEVIQGTKGINYNMPQNKKPQAKSTNKNRLKIKGEKYSS